MYGKKGKICPAYVFKQNANSEIQVILLLISNREKLHEAKSEGRWHYLAVKKLSTLLRGITFDDFFGDFYCLNCFYSIVSESKLHSHKRVCENKDFCNIILSSEDANPANILLDEDVLKTSSRRLSSPEDVLKTS